ncbi:DUF5682 family protein [Streptomyces sp. NPDC047928]|uniref:DUF5682 family protein n=1 Tax=unclassified Streptomyces TaxID=2593676 RepID=UPI003715C6F2
MTGPLLLGVRHHGPGSARAVRAALDATRPRAVLVEGPPEGDALLPLAADEGMRPPVALLAHATGDPGRAAFWPLAEFSPEWVAIRWALDHGAAVRFIDLPAAHSLAMAADPTWGDEDEGEADGITGDTGAGTEHGLRLDPLAVLAQTAGYDDPERWWEDVVEHRAAGRASAPGRSSADATDRSDAALGATDRHDAGATDRSDAAPGATDRHDADATDRSDAGADATDRHDADAHADGAPASAGPAPHTCAGSTTDTSTGSTTDASASSATDPSAGSSAGASGGGGTDPVAPFTALAEAMTALREAYGHGGHDRDLIREAYMRLQLRAARKEHGDAVAVVCGAWHVPALRATPTVAADRALLKGLPKVKAETTWVPWTHRRLARRSGYGAGITSPGWYGHLFTAPDRPVERWMTKVAGLLRDEDRMVSSAHVIEAVRLAGTLAAMRGRPLPGLGETTDAVRAVMCDGSDVPLALIHDRLVIGDVIGEVPPDAPAVPLQRDLDRTQRTLRLKPEAHTRELDLDLRKDTDAARSRLLHRLRLLGVDWGEPVTARGGSTGTFRESWRLRWEPELHVGIAEAGAWGTTVLTAATARAQDLAAAAATLSDITALAERCLLADLPEALPVVMKALADRAALDADVGHLAEALPALARSLRYGDVRATDTAALADVATGLALRVFVGLPPACAGLDADGAAAMRRHLDGVHTALRLLPDHEELTGRWGAVLDRLTARDGIPGVLRGRSARLLLDDGRLATDDAARLMGLALSPGTVPADAAAWIEGFVGGAPGGARDPAGGLLLVHDERLLGLVDAWLSGVSAEAFTDVLPLLRRTFSAYEPGVRRTLGELVRRGPGSAGTAAPDAGTPGFGAGLDTARADAVVPLVRLLLGAGTTDDNDLVEVGR